MLKTECVCDRCGKTFPEKESKTVIIRRARKARRAEENGSKILNAFENFLSRIAIKDYCQECVTAFKEFLKMKEGVKNENDSN